MREGRGRETGFATGSKGDPPGRTGHPIDDAGTGLRDARLDRTGDSMELPYVTLG